MENNVQQKNDSKKIPTAIFSQQIYSSPLPPPEVLAKYKQIDPQLLSKIIQMTETQCERIGNIEEKQLKEIIRIQKRRDNETNLGQFFAFLIIIAAIFTSAYLANKGHDNAAIFISSIGLANLIPTFIKGRNKEDEKSKQ